VFAPVGRRIGVLAEALDLLLLKRSVVLGCLDELKETLLSRVLAFGFPTW